jgi:hypothetical protein
MLKLMRIAAIPDKSHANARSKTTQAQLNLIVLFFAHFRKQKDARKFKSVDAATTTSLRSCQNATEASVILSLLVVAIFR